MIIHSRLTKQIRGKLSKIKLVENDKQAQNAVQQSDQAHVQMRTPNSKEKNLNTPVFFLGVLQLLKRAAK
jgi:hypothetical protein